MPRATPTMGSVVSTTVAYRTFLTRPPRSNWTSGSLATASKRRRACSLGAFRIKVKTSPRGRLSRSRIEGSASRRGWRQTLDSRFDEGSLATARPPNIQAWRTRNAICHPGAQDVGGKQPGCLLIQFHETANQMGQVCKQTLDTSEVLGFRRAVAVALRA